MKKITKLKREVMDIMMKGTLAQRKYIASKRFSYFCFYYFPEYFIYKTPDFHWDFFHDCENIDIGELRDVLWIAFRESAKTTIAKMFVTWCICYRKKKYIAWDSYDGTNSEQALFDIIMNLQTNKKIINDFGRLYKKKKSQKTKDEQEEDAPEMKRGSVFITTNKIKVECFTTQYSARGRVSGKERPDLFVFDDIENNVTKNSIRLTQKIIAHVDEVNTGLQNSGSMLYLGNYITEEGSIAHIRDRLEGKKGKIVRDIPMVTVDSEGNKTPSWPGKYVLTNKEALQKNINLPIPNYMISIEQKKEDWGDKVFETEGQNNPGKSGDYFFDREKVRIARDKAYDAKKEVALFKTWDIFNPKHRYGLGSDTAEGIGSDHSTSVIIDFSQRPAQVVATYKNNEMPHNIFGNELIRHARAYGECFILPEINQTGYSTVATLIQEGYYNMYRREVKNKTSGKVQKEYGWRTGSSNKNDIFNHFKTAFEEGELVIYDKDLLNEMYHYTKQHLRLLKKEEGMTRHFDLLMAATLAWEARHYATLSKEEKKDLYKSPNAGKASESKPYIV